MRHLWLILLAGPAVAQPECSVKGGTLVEYAIACASEAYDLRHDEMVLALDRLVGGVLPETYNTRNLLDSQALWEVYADAFCTAQADVFGTGLLATKTRYECLARMTEDRRDVLLEMGDRVGEARGLPRRR